MTSQTILEPDIDDGQTRFENIPSYGGATFLQDSYGFIWLGVTLDNIYYFDGYDYKSLDIGNDIGDSLIVSNGIVYEIVEDKQKNIWICTGTGLHRWDRASEKITSLYIDSLNIVSDDNFIFSIKEDSKSRFWVFTKAGLYLLYPQKGLIKDYTNVIEGTEYSNYFVTLWHKNRFLEDNDGDIWICTYQGLVRFNDEKNNFNIYQHKIDDPESISSDFVTGIVQDSDGDIWVTTYGGGLNKLIKRKNEFELEFIHFKKNSHRGAKIVSDTILGHYIDKYDNLWIGGGNGFSIIDKKSNEFYSYTINSETEMVLCEFVEDYIGNVWILQIGHKKGIYRFNQSSRQLDFLTGSTQNSNSLRSNYINGINDDYYSNIWISVWGGSSILKKQWYNHKYYINVCNDYISCFVLDDKELWICEHGEDRRILLWANGKTKNEVVLGKKRFIYSVVKDSNNVFWIGTSLGLMKYKKDWTKAKQCNPKKHIRDLEKKSQEELWLATFEGLELYNDKSGTSIVFKMDTGALTNNYITVVKDYGDKYLWIGTDDKGLAKFDKRKKIFEFFDSIQDVKTRLKRIHSIHDDSLGNLWILSQTFLYKFSKEKGLFKRIKTDKFSVVSQIIGVWRNKLWVHTFKELVCVDLVSEKIDWFQLPNGYGSYLDVPEPSLIVNGKAYIGGCGKYMTVVLDSLKHDTIAPKLHVLSFYLSNIRQYFPKPIYELDTIELHHNDKEFSFKFSALNYNNPEYTTYKYKLENYDTAWVGCGIERKAKYMNIPPGEYLFKVKAFDENMAWEVDSKTIKIIIHPPFWATWWFRVIVVALFVTVIWAYIKLRERNLQHQNKMLESEVKERTAEVVKQNEEIEQKNQELKQQNEEIITINSSLSHQKTLVEERNIELKQQNEEITTQRDQLSHQHQAITESILYAKRIQSAVMPRQDYIDEVLPENFILFKPKDKVSGDFYWVKQVNNYIVIAAADCTGHGVPGAIMSMLGISFINEIVQKREVTQCNYALNELRKQVKRALHQTGKTGEADDGMDIALCALDIRTNVLQYSGANNSLYLIQNNEFIEVKADRMPIGFYPNEMTKFTNHEIKLQEGDTFYLFSDGFADQFGGAKGLKYKSKNFQKLLLEHHNKPLSIQKELLEDELTSWMKGYEQTDDILVMGVRV